MFTKENLLRCEVFPAELPPCFSTASLGKCADHAITATNACNQKFSIPLKYSGYKSESSRRKFAIPNPYHYCKAVDAIVKKESEISAILKKALTLLPHQLKSQQKNTKHMQRSQKVLLIQKKKLRNNTKIIVTK